MLVEFGAEEIAGAAGVRKKLFDSDFGGDVFVRIVGEIFAERVAEFEFSVLRELQNGGGGEHFVHRADAKFRVERVGDFLVAVGHAVGGSENRRAVFRDERGAGEAVGGGFLLQLFFEGGESVALRHARYRKFRRRRDAVSDRPVMYVRCAGSTSMTRRAN